MSNNSINSSYSIDTNNNNIISDPKREKILWASVSRNGTILAEAGEDHFGGAVSEAAQGILSKKETPGYEYYTSRSKSMSSLTGRRSTPRLKAVKFHVFEYNHEQDDDDDNNNNKKETSEPLVWVFAAVFNPEASTWENPKDALSDVQEFLQKVVCLTEMNRLSDPMWREGPQLACQRSFASTLLQRMQEVTYYGKMARLNQSVQDTTELMQSNITAIMEREEKLQRLDEKGSQLQDMAVAFKKNSKSIRRRMMLQNAKHGAILGTAITAGVAVIVIPPILVLL